MSIATPARAEIFAIARNGQTAAASCKDGRVRVETLPNGQVARSFELNRSPAVEILLSHGWAACLRLRHRRPADRPRPQPRHGCSRDGAMLAVATVGAPAPIFDPRLKQRLFQLTSDFSGAAAVAFSPDGSLISGTLLRSYAQQKDLVGHLDPPAAQAVAVSYFRFREQPSRAVMVFDVSSGNVRGQWMAGCAAYWWRGSLTDLGC